MSKLEIQPTALEGVSVISPEVYEDERGSFFESYKTSDFESIGIPDVFVQDNQSISKKGVLRGMHFQAGDTAQGKLVRVVRGSVLDVVVDVNKESSTFKKWISIVLSGENKKMLWIPPGYAHGFLSLEDDTFFVYKCTELYNKESERGFVWNDPNVAIDWQLSEWGIEKPLLSDRDNGLPLLQDVFQ